MTDAFAPDEGGVGSMRAVLAQADGKVVLAGYADTGAEVEFIVQRRAWSASSQSLDPAFGDGGTTTINFDEDGNLSLSSALGAVLDHEGRVVVVGFTGVEGSGVQRMAVVRLQGDRIFRNGFDGS